MRPTNKENRPGYINGQPIQWQTRDADNYREATAAVTLNGCVLKVGVGFTMKYVYQSRCPRKLFQSMLRSLEQGLRESIR